MTSSAVLGQIHHLQIQFQANCEKLKKAQKSYQQTVAANSQLDTQLNENTMVKDELDLVKNENAVAYKLSGPVLIRQSIGDARANVANRIKYIESEIKKNKELLDTHRKSVDSERETISKIEEHLQKLLRKVHIP